MIKPVVLAKAALSENSPSAICTSPAGNTARMRRNAEGICRVVSRHFTSSLQRFRPHTYRRGGADPVQGAEDVESVLIGHEADEDAGQAAEEEAEGEDGLGRV
jgi:hypothetical protein